MSSLLDINAGVPQDSVLSASLDLFHSNNLLVIPSLMVRRQHRSGDDNLVKFNVLKEALKELHPILSNSIFVRYINIVLRSLRAKRDLYLA